MLVQINHGRILRLAQPVTRHFLKSKIILSILQEEDFEMQL